MAANPAITTNRTPKTVRVLMWNVSSPMADFWFTVSNVILIVGALAVFVGTIGSITMGAAKEHFSDLRISENELATSKANRRAAELEKEAASLEADNLSLQTSLRPRRLSFPGWTTNLEKAASITKELEKFRGTVAFIQVVPDFEARIFAQDVATVLANVGWKIEFVDEARSHLSETSFPEGVTLFTVSDGKSSTQAGTAFWTALTEADALMSGTGTFGAYIFHKILEKPEPGFPYFDPPITAVLIRIGLKPFTSQFLDIQRRNIERQERQFDRSLRAIYEQSGSLSFSVPIHFPIAVKPGPNDGEWIAINPDEQKFLPKKSSPMLVLPGMMLRSSPADKQ
jgi:hypothetical protein